MNVTLRVITNRRSLIVKQARPFVAKYPSIEAPIDRLWIEEQFYRTVEPFPEVAGRMPRIVASDVGAYTLVLEDLTEAEDLVTLYEGRQEIDARRVTELARHLAHLHGIAVDGSSERYANRSMRKLNHAHLYVIPLASPDRARLQSLEAGLDVAADRVAADAAYSDKVRATGEQYLADGEYLLHGDYFPGSWMADDQHVWVIDPEFAFLGPVEFDLGCALAHFAMARQPKTTAEQFIADYVAIRCDSLDFGLLSRFAASEVMRSLIGVAQLPIPPSDGWRAALLKRSRAPMMQDNWNLLWE